MNLFYSTPDHNGQSMEIHIEYDPKTAQVTAITGIYIRTPHMVMNVSELLITLVPETQNAIESIIARVGWQQIYENHQIAPNA